MKAPKPARHQLVGSRHLNLRINLGCFCTEDSRCHRSQLAKLIREASKRLPPPAETLAKLFSPPRSILEIED